MGTARVHDNNNNINYSTFKTFKMKTTINDLVGKTLISIMKTDDEITFKCSDGDMFQMYHYQDCCENVYIEDIDGDLLDLINSPIIIAEERDNIDESTLPDYRDESFTWTFYTIRNVNASVTIRWYGASNGYYSESVEFIKINS